MKQRNLFIAVTAGGALGLLASFMQSIEKIRLLKNADQALACDLNSVFSCTHVLNAWQSSAFGFPNSFLCMVFFTIFMTVGLVGLTGAALSRYFRLAIQGLSLFVLGFGLWFLWQSTYVIGALCLYCIFCMIGLITVNAAWLRINANDLPFSESAKKRLQAHITKGTDIFGWFLLAALIALSMILEFR
ncbi:MAG TPA: vitamin K epoxide reductase family protein [Candidatus Saccharimonadales bacterium]|nr:vitamin K epoxide reductase family protein [Candidatus Saccharimonadales bacterium]